MRVVAAKPLPALLVTSVASLAASLTGTFGSGCVSRPTDPLVAAGAAYRSAEYGRAATLARRAGDGASGLARDRANYLEGIALLQLGRLDDAATEGSADPEAAKSSGAASSSRPS